MWILQKASPARTGDPTGACLGAGPGRCDGPSCGPPIDPARKTLLGGHGRKNGVVLAVMKEGRSSGPAPSKNRQPGYLGGGRPWLPCINRTALRSAGAPLGFARKHARPCLAFAFRGSCRASGPVEFCWHGKLEELAADDIRGRWIARGGGFPLENQVSPTGRNRDGRFAAPWGLLRALKSSYGFSSPCPRRRLMRYALFGNGRNRMGDP